ncbi:hypothetical protein POF50_016725 [Streptomyces sp. SL13]|uniref:Secreted protein n=1 Tax=Streptantibioticus silvisoli TaxID=2705255 RepID=A0AA90H5V7_9ACTN|nr:hypothetical protein [Streptantibioticus silvisoli]MDI5961163.1 hypothetical protein [Streptantibioticus silvisoli]MDI5970967.1 hypothetical protein [Streptantibioticus silvisoli]
MRRRIGLDELIEKAPAPQQATAPARQPGPREDRRHLLRTEFEFELPRGYLDDDGVLHRHGAMRLATARDELMPQIDLRVKENPAYLSVVLLSHVITRLGDITDVHTGVVERMYATDVAFLQDFYQRVNSEGHTRAAVTCPQCDGSFEIDLAGGRLGES